jgi:UDP-N-acetylmuramoyl-L-alanyl-D-glutamate--2,6-diaminopimelate ligase
VGLLAAALGASSRPVASVTTLGAFLDDEPFASAMNHEGLVAAMEAGLRRGGKHVVLEMTSEALALGYARVWPCQSAIFTNLTHDHLDAHRSPEHYLASKAQLFMALPEGGHAVLNGCDAAGPLIGEVVPAGVRVVYYGVASRGSPQLPLDLEASEVEVSWSGTRARLTSTLPGLPEWLEVRAIGAEYLENALAALACAVLSGVEPRAAAEAIAAKAPPPGRFQVYGDGPRVVVDFAHSPDALLRTLRTARSLCQGELCVVFGAGGNRDRDKRQPMGQAARLADRVVLTMDNCRDEDPAAICRAIEDGLQGHARVSTDLDRARAISEAILAAGSDDVVVIAGRGPDRELVIGPTRTLLVDGDVAQAALQKRVR